jgi:hypothetical protein
MELLPFKFFQNGGCHHLALDDEWPLTQNSSWMFQSLSTVQIWCHYLYVGLRCEFSCIFQVWLGNHTPRPLFGGFRPLTLEICWVKPQKGTSSGENASLEPLTMEIGSPIRPVEVSKQMIGKGRKAKHKSHKCYISRSHTDGTPEAILKKFGPHVQRHQFC